MLQIIGGTLCVNPLCFSDSLIRTLANSEYPDEMPQDAALHWGLHCLPKQKQFSEKKYTQQKCQLSTIFY